MDRTCVRFQSGQRVIGESIVVRITDMILGTIFLFAAVPKIIDPWTFARTIAAFRIFPAHMVWFPSLFLPIFEIMWAGILLVGYARVVARFTLLSLLAIYTLVMLWAIWRHIDVTCGCFGSDGTGLLTAIVRNLTIILICSTAVLTLRMKGPHRLAITMSLWLRIVIAGSVVTGVLIVASVQSQSVDNPTKNLGKIASTQRDLNKDISIVEPISREQKTRSPSLLLTSGGRYERRYTELRDWRGQTMTYWVNLPTSFDLSLRYPILLEWHGAGGSAQTRLFPDVYQVDGYIHVGLTYAWGTQGEKAPLYPTSEYIQFIQHVCQDVVSVFHGDDDRIVIGGFSAGGYMATGAGISILWRAGFRGKLKGVVAGGCNWMCDPRYTRGLDILLWYSQDDLNSSDLIRRLPEIRQHAKSLVVVARPGDNHVCDNAIEGPAIRKFLAQFQ